jgi:hypothetical protein
MNLVIDDAVEVQLLTKESSEKRRQLGEQTWHQAEGID